MTKGLSWVGCAVCLTVGVACGSSNGSTVPDASAKTSTSHGSSASTAGSTRSEGTSRRASSSSKASSVVPTVTFGCLVTLEGAPNNCVLYVDIPVSSEASLKSNCTAMKPGSIVTSCPTMGRTGCCAITGSGGSSQQECAYSAAAAMGLQAQCTGEGGTWTSLEDAGTLPDAGSYCSQLASCCKNGHFTSFDANMKATCNAAVKAGKESGCEDQLTALTAEGICGVSSDAGHD